MYFREYLSCNLFMNPKCILSIVVAHRTQFVVSPLAIRISLLNLSLPWLKHVIDSDLILLLYVAPMCRFIAMASLHWKIVWNVVINFNHIKTKCACFTIKTFICTVLYIIQWKWPDLKVVPFVFHLWAHLNPIPLIFSRHCPCLSLNSS